jgi:excinuclease ABC subunit B
MKSAIEETRRRREIQREYNEEHGYEPRTIEKEVGETNLPGSETDTGSVAGVKPDGAEEARAYVEDLQRRMEEAADNLEFELAADIRDRIREVREAHELDADEGVPPEDESGGIPTPEEF